jgi:hypothetical protein
MTTDSYKAIEEKYLNETNMSDEEEKMLEMNLNYTDFPNI